MDTELRADNPLLRLSTKQTPVLPPGITYLMQAMMDESLNFAQLAEIVERFPSIAARLIGLANSVWSSPVTPISSLEMACSRLGFSVVRSTCIALAVASPFDPTRCPAFDAKRFWCHSMLVADTADWLAQATRNEQTFPSQTTRTAGLLHDLPQLWLADQLPDEWNRSILYCQENPKVNLERALLTLTGIEMSEVGKLLASAWQLPAPLEIVMSRIVLRPRAATYWGITHLVDLADCLVSALGKETPCPITDTRLAALGLKHENVVNVSQLLYDQSPITNKLAQVLFNRLPVTRSVTCLG